tara:strand:- start:142 stop:270 length:129 start_codon:yes stop_codon:yes gene_type:complete
MLAAAEILACKTNKTHDNNKQQQQQQPKKKEGVLLKYLLTIF